MGLIFHEVHFHSVLNKSCSFSDVFMIRLLSHLFQWLLYQSRLCLIHFSMHSSAHLSVSHVFPASGLAADIPDPWGSNRPTHGQDHIFLLETVWDQCTSALRTLSQ